MIDSVLTSAFIILLLVIFLGIGLIRWVLAKEKRYEAQEEREMLSGTGDLRSDALSKVAHKTHRRPSAKMPSTSAFSIANESQEEQLHCDEK